jgi:hypothetical protein
MSNVQPKLLLVRAREGLVGDVQRSCHVVIVPDDGALPDFLTARCGVRFTPGSAELLNQISGMPCEVCIAKTPVTQRPALDRSRAGSDAEPAP